MSSLEGAAWVTDGATTYIAKASVPASAHAPISPVTELIQGVYQQRPDQARRILRNRIFTDVAPTILCKAMVKVAAKRLTHDPSLIPPPPGAVIDVTSRWPSPVLLPDPPPPDFMADHARAMTFALGLLNRGSSVSLAHPDDLRPRYARDRPVAALLVSREGTPLATARNTGSVNRALHAEVNLVQMWFRATGRPLPLGARIYVTLKCCRMCAAMIWHAAEDIRTLSIHFAERDPGPNARATALDRGSYDRGQAATSDPSLLDIEIQFEQPAVPIPPRDGL